MMCCDGTAYQPEFMFVPAGTLGVWIGAVLVSLRRVVKNKMDV